MEITQQQLKEKLLYVPETGYFISLRTNKRIGFRHNTRSKKDFDIGKTNKFYRKIEFKEFGKRFYEHRLAWLYVYGSVPISGFQIDHIDGDGENNKITNLRIVNQSENNSNRKISNMRIRRGAGIYYSKRNDRWEARMETKGKRITRVFKTKDEAICQRLKWEKEFGVACTARE